MARSDGYRCAKQRNVMTNLRQPISFQGFSGVERAAIPRPAASANYHFSGWRPCVSGSVWWYGQAALAGVQTGL
jgi:hypothetical protein